MITCSAWHRTADGTRDVVAHGRYLDRYRKEQGIWRFAARSLVLDWAEERAVLDDAAANAGVVQGRPGVTIRLPACWPLRDRAQR